MKVILRLIFPVFLCISTTLQAQSLQKLSIDTPIDTFKLANDYLEKGNLRFKSYSFSECLADFNEAIRLKPDFAEAFNARGSYYRLLNNYSSALSDFNEAIRLKPQNSGFMCNRAILKEMLGKYEEAVLDYDEAIRLKPDSANLFIYRGTSKRYLRKFDEAMLDYNQ